MASTLNLGLAAIAGLAVGAAGATLARRRDDNSQVPAFPPPPPPTAPSTVPSSQPRPANTFDSRLTGVDLARRVTDPVSIGELDLASKKKEEGKRGLGAQRSVTLCSRFGMTFQID